MTNLDNYFNKYGFTLKVFPDGNTPFTVKYVIEFGGSPKAIFNYRNNKIDHEFWSLASRRLSSIIMNGQSFDSNVIYDDASLKHFIDSNYIKLNPDTKLDAVLEYFYKESSYDGDTVEDKVSTDLQAMMMYYENKQEWRFYLTTAQRLGYLMPATQGKSFGRKYALTIDGLAKVISILKGKESKVSFVAMAFTAEMKIIYLNAIMPAIVECGYEPYIVNDLDVDSDKTINDAILAGIKKAKFTIADFTDHRNGVYFESGFALGRGQKVIYMCREDQMSQSHFDLRNYQHIVWKDSEDLKKRLRDKIEAFIND